MKTGAMTNPMIPDSSSAPRMARRPTVPPPSAEPMANIVDTAANEVPWTIGWRAPIFQMPSVCRSVATPEMNRPADTR